MGRQHIQAVHLATSERELITFRNERDECLSVTCLQPPDPEIAVPKLTTSRQSPVCSVVYRKVYLCSTTPGHCSIWAKSCDSGCFDCFLHAVIFQSHFFQVTQTGVSGCADPILADMCSCAVNSQLHTSNNSLTDMQTCEVGTTLLETSLRYSRDTCNFCYGTNL